ncbi:MAG TPA: hypothetical protein VLH39_07370, partial [Magnetospirillaceae bacterium]|nr:hypothetical protein [Magnetospirillaceae bacterium]
MFLLQAFCVLAMSCADPLVLGARAGELQDRLRGGDRSLILSAPLEKLDELERLGPGALYYSARAAGLAGDTVREAVLLGLAADRESGIFRRRARELYPEALYRAADWAGLLEFLDLERGASGESYLPRRRRAESLAALGRLPEARAELSVLESSFPGRIAADASLLAALRVRIADSPAEQAARVRELFALPSARSEDLEMAMAILEVSVPETGEDSRGDIDTPPTFSAEELALFRLRTEVARRDYGAAVRAINSQDGPILSPSLPRAFLSDAGKAFLYASATAEGIPAMTALEASAEAALSASPGARKPREALFLAVFYRARMLRREEQHTPADAGFARAWDLALTGEDRDTAAWHRVEGMLPQNRTGAAAWLARTAPTWHNPAAFSSVVERLSREALLAGDGATLHALRRQLAPRLTPRTEARLAYLAGRAAETGIAPLAQEPGRPLPDAGNYARAAYEEALARSPESYYRLLAAHRLGRPLLRIPPAGPVDAGLPDAPAPREDRDAAPAEINAEDYLAGFAEFGLAEL